MATSSERDCLFVCGSNKELAVCSFSDSCSKQDRYLLNLLVDIMAWDKIIDKLSKEKDNTECKIWYSGKQITHINQPIDDPREWIEWGDQIIKQCKACENLKYNTKILEIKSH